jgi:hypothetical protein
MRLMTAAALLAASLALTACGEDEEDAQDEQSTENSGGAESDGGESGGAAEATVTLAGGENDLSYTVELRTCEISADSMDVSSSTATTPTIQLSDAEGDGVASFFAVLEDDTIVETSGDFTYEIDEDGVLTGEIAQRGGGTVTVVASCG